MVNDPPSLRRSPSTESLQTQGSTSRTQQTTNQHPQTGADISSSENHAASLQSDGDDELYPVARSRRVAISQSDLAIQAAAHNALMSSSQKIAAANSSLEHETARRNAEQFMDNVKKLAQLGTANENIKERMAQSANAARLRLLTKLMHDNPKSLSVMLAELRKLTEGLETATLVLAIKNLIRFLNDQADLFTNDHLARVKMTEADKLDKFMIKHLLNELLQEAATRLYKATHETQQNFDKLTPLESSEIIDRI